MTHEELMETIKDKFNFHTGKHDAEIVNALYKVVELHIRVLDPVGRPECLSCRRHYPCPTIQAIEKELK